MGAVCWTNLICEKDMREEAQAYHKNVIGVFKLDPSDKSETLVGHVPNELLGLLTYSIGKRKKEHGLVIPVKYIATTERKDFANISMNKIFEKKDKHPGFLK